MIFKTNRNESGLASSYEDVSINNKYQPIVVENSNDDQDTDKDKDEDEKVNPYGDPIKEFISEISEIKWKFPFIAQTIHIFILSFVIFIVAILYSTVGIASQICGRFWRLTLESAENAEYGSAVGKSAYVIQTGIYFLCFSPFWLIQFPFWLVGKMYGIFGRYIFVIIGGFVLIFLIYPDIINNIYFYIKEFKSSFLIFIKTFSQWDLMVKYVFVWVIFRSLHRN